MIKVDTSKSLLAISGKPTELVDELVSVVAAFVEEVSKKDGFFGLSGLSEQTKREILIEFINVSLKDILIDEGVYS